MSDFFFIFNMRSIFKFSVRHLYEPSDINYSLTFISHPWIGVPKEMHYYVTRCLLLQLRRHAHTGGWSEVEHAIIPCTNCPSFKASSNKINLELSSQGGTIRRKDTLLPYLTLFTTVIFLVWASLLESCSIH